MQRTPWIALALTCAASLVACDAPPIDGDDAGPGMDSGQVDTDSGMTNMDAGPDDEDGGGSNMDGGTPPDGGGDPDGGTDPDSGTGEDDGGTDPDGGADPDGGTVPDGCSDGVHNGDETDVDCGGPTCAARCGATEMCSARSDCQSDVCISGRCQAASCSDGIRNGDETDRDCGGSCTTKCPNGSMCMGVADCADSTAMCTGGFCQPGACADGTRNGSETDVDCGGGTCAPCGNGDMCTLPRDCASSICLGSVCHPAECTNGVMDGTEIGVDCGGDCPGCPAGTACTAAEQCLSDRCEDSLCASCADGVRSGAETDVDCGGGVCGPCSRGRDCLVDSDCAFGACLPDGTCDGPTEFYRQGFEADDGGWVADTGSDWVWGTPMKTDLAGAYAGTGAWVTRLTGDYSSNQNHTLTSPSIDLSAASDDPAIELAVIYETEASSSSDIAWDGARIEVSTDGGTTWQTLGAKGTGPNWYDRTMSGGPGGPIWGGSSSGWRIASHVLTGTAGESDVRVRMRFRSDFGTTDEGFAFDDVVIRAPIPNLSVAVRAVPDICGQVVASVTNTGEMTIPSATFRYGIGSSRATVTLTDFAPGATEARTLFAANGDTINAEAVSAFDDNPTDDVASVILTSLSIPIDRTTPYTESFDAGDGGWATTGTNSSWEHGVPAGSVIDTAHSGTSAWVTNLDGNYNSNELSYLVSPCFDASGATADLRLSFAQNYITEGCCDEGWIEYSVDGGNTWQKVLGGAGAENWYNDTSNRWWDGESEGWRMVSASLPGTARKPSVRIRHVFSSDSSSVRDGFAMDTVTIEASGQPDLSVEMRRAPTCGAVEAVVTNVGTAPVNAYALTLTRDGVSQRLTVLETILPGEAVVYPLEATSLAGAHAEAPGDVDPSNDQDMIQPSIVVTGGYHEDFEADGGDYRVGGTNASWEHGAPAGAFISGPAGGVNAWVTNLDGSYSGSERSTLTSPCFDLSALTADPVLSFSHIYETEAYNDSTWVEISLDGGATWAKLGRAAAGTNWYTDPILDWWNGTSGAAGIWRTASHPMTGSAGRDQVRFRFVFRSDASLEEDGVGVDNIDITP